MLKLLCWGGAVGFWLGATSSSTSSAEDRLANCCCCPDVDSGGVVAGWRLANDDPRANPRVNFGTDLPLNRLASKGEELSSLSRTNRASEEDWAGRRPSLSAAPASRWLNLSTLGGGATGASAPLPLRDSSPPVEEAGKVRSAENAIDVTSLLLSATTRASDVRSRAIIGRWVAVLKPPNPKSDPRERIWTLGAGVGIRSRGGSLTSGVSLGLISLEPISTALKRPLDLPPPLCGALGSSLTAAGCWGISSGAEWKRIGDLTLVSSFCATVTSSMKLIGLMSWKLFAFRPCGWITCCVSGFELARGGIAPPLFLGSGANGSASSTSNLSVFGCWLLVTFLLLCGWVSWVGMGASYSSRSGPAPGAALSSTSLMNGGRVFERLLSRVKSCCWRKRSGRRSPVTRACCGSTSWKCFKTIEHDGYSDVEALTEMQASLLTLKYHKLTLNFLVFRGSCRRRGGSSSTLFWVVSGKAGEKRYKSIQGQKQSMGIWSSSRCFYISSNIQQSTRVVVDLFTWNVALMLSHSIAESTWLWTKQKFLSNIYCINTFQRIWRVSSEWLYRRCVTFKVYKL